MINVLEIHEKIHKQVLCIFLSFPNYMNELKFYLPSFCFIVVKYAVIRQLCFNMFIKISFCFFFFNFEVTELDFSWITTVSLSNSKAVLYEISLFV